MTSSWTSTAEVHLIAALELSVVWKKPSHQNKSCQCTAIWIGWDLTFLYFATLDFVHNVTWCLITHSWKLSHFLVKSLPFCRHQHCCRRTLESSCMCNVTRIVEMFLWHICSIQIWTLSFFAKTLNARNFIPATGLSASKTFFSLSKRFLGYFVNPNWRSEDRGCCMLSRL